MADLVSVGAGAGQGEEIAQALLRDPRGQQCLPDLPLVQQWVPHLRELLIGEVLAVAQEAASGLPLRVAGASAGLGGGAAPECGEHFVGELDDVEVVDHDDGDVGDFLAPGQRCGGQPGQDVGDGAALDLAEQPSVAQRVDKPGVPPIPGQAPLAAVGVPLPLRPAPPGLVDTQHPHLGQRGVEGLARRCAEGAHHRRPGQMQVAGGLDDRGAGIAHSAPGCLAQPGGDPRPGRYLGDALGKRLPRALRLAAPPAALVPQQHQPALPVGKIPRTGPGCALHLPGEGPALRAGASRFLRRGQMHTAGAVPKPLDLYDGHPVEVEQQRRIVDHARGSHMIVLPREQK